jgi:hypothetical protein
MHRQNKGFRTCVGLGLTAVLALAACSNEPTASPDALVPVSSPGSVVNATLSGPDSVWVSATFTYTARFFVPYAWFEWRGRDCTTGTVASCTTAWTVLPHTKVDDWTDKMTHFISRDCTLNGQRSYQVQVIAHGFGQAQTLYKVTNRCKRGDPNPVEP